MAKRVLIVEDNEDNSKIYSMVLQHAGFEVREAGDGASGVVQATEFQPDLIVLDVGLPRMSGWEVCRIVKSLPKTKHIQVLFVTAHAYPEDREMAFQVGGDGYLPKPVEPRRIAGEVIKMIGPP